MGNPFLSLSAEGNGDFEELRRQQSQDSRKWASSTTEWSSTSSQHTTLSPALNYNLRNVGI